MPRITVNGELPKPTTFEDLDYVKVVRCKDCKYWDDNGIITKCEKHIGNGYPGDWFCADGQHKEGK